MVVWLQHFPWKDACSPHVSPWFALLCIVFVIVIVFAALIIAALKIERGKRD
jgi:hypothetical protein